MFAILELHQDQHTIFILFLTSSNSKQIINHTYTLYILLIRRGFPDHTKTNIQYMVALYRDNNSKWTQNKRRKQKNKELTVQCRTFFLVSSEISVKGYHYNKSTTMAGITIIPVPFTIRDNNGSLQISTYSSGKRKELGKEIRMTHVFHTFSTQLLNRISYCVRLLPTIIRFPAPIQAMPSLCVLFSSFTTLWAGAITLLQSIPIVTNNKNHMFPLTLLFEIMCVPTSQYHSIVLPLDFGVKPCTFYCSYAMDMCFPFIVILLLLVLVPSWNPK